MGGRDGSKGGSKHWRIILGRTDTWFITMVSCKSPEDRVVPHPKWPDFMAYLYLGVTSTIYVRRDDPRRATGIACIFGPAIGTWFPGTPVAVATTVLEDISSKLATCKQGIRDSVDGWNPAPWTWHVWNPVINGIFTIYQLVQDFCHQQYHDVIKTSRLGRKRYLHGGWDPG